jgi:VanZ family protein
MRLIFTILSIAYIAAIFLFAGSSVVSDLSSFNPYSLLHIPLYGILTFLLIFSFVPMTQLPNYLITRFLVVGIIALIVAIADEIHQAYVPGRDASITDVLLDLGGIILILFIFLYFYKTQKIRKANTIIT